MSKVYSFPLLLSLVDGRIWHLRTVSVLPAGSPWYTPRRVVVGKDSPRSERDGARNTKI